MSNRNQVRSPLWRHTALAVALSMSLGGVAMAQSTTGSIFGQAPAAAGETVVVTGSSGVTREVAVDSSGHFSVNNIPVGTYTVTLKKDGAVVDTRKDVALQAGGGTAVSFETAVNATQLGAVTVSANALPAIDVSSVNSSTVITAADLQKLPVGRNAESIALLAPGTVAGSGYFGNAVAFGGSSVSENAYYVNGYNTGEPYRNIGGFALPYGAIDQQQTLTGGYSAKYGRSDGGVINQIGKRGTNEWHFGGQITWAPKFLHEGGKNVYYPNPTIPGPTPNGQAFVINNPDLVGKLYRYRDQNKTWETTTSAYVGGPLVKDKLYMFLAVEETKSHGTNIQNLDLSRQLEYTDHNAKYYGKIDWNINENNVFEYTAMQQNQSNGAGATYAFDYDTLKRGAFVTPGDKTKDDSKFQIAKYTSYLSDEATLSVEYGKGDFKDPVIYGNDTSLPFISRATNQDPTLNGGSPITNSQPNTSVIAPNAENHTKGLRVDFDYRLGDHDLGVGLDNMTYSASNQGIAPSGPGYYWRYLKSTDANPYYVQYRQISFKTSMSMKQKAYYLQDIWQATPNLLFNIGVRNDRFTNYNDLGRAFVDEKNQWEPRLGVSWDVNGDSSFKVYGNAGRYYLALPDNAAERAANRSTYLTQNFTYTGIDANGVPTGLAPLNALHSPDGEDGGPKDPRQVTASNLKAQYLDEYIVGFDKQLNDKWNYGAKIMYRDLKTAIDDECSPPQIATKMAAMGLDPKEYSDSLYGANYCRLINPGLTNTIVVAKNDGSGYTNVQMSQADWGYLQGVKRTNTSVNLYLEHPFDGKWQARIDYTWSRGRGNTEGQVRSDFGQQDVSKTEDWDSWQLMQGQDGELMNVRKHAIKARGAYQITPEWLVSGTLTVQSGTPKECLGYFGPNANEDPTGYNNGADGNYHWCAGKIVHPGDNGHTPWTKELNLGVRYAPAFADHKLAVKLDVFNVTNEQKAVQTNPVFAAGDHVVSNQYQQGIYFQAPRYVRLSVSYDY